MHQLASALHGLIVHAGYAGLFLVMVLGNLGIPVGTEVVMPTAGALAGQGQLPDVVLPAWVIAAIVGTLGEIVGGIILYTIGYYGGAAFVHRWGRYVGFREHHLAQVHGFYERWGKPTVFWCRFLPFVRGVAALPPGISRMPKRWFVTYTALGSAIFCTALAYAGDRAGRHVDALLEYVHRGGLVALLVALAIVAAGIVWWRVASAKRRAVAAERAGTP